MPKKARVNVYAKDALYIIAHFGDFDGDVEAWKNAVYQVFRCNMTWSFAHMIDVREGRNLGVYICIIANPVYEENIVSFMEDNGFRNIKTHHEDIGAIECTDLPGDMLIDFAIVDY